MTKQGHVQIRRIYDPPLSSDGARVLVDRLWPRGISKERAHLDMWCKEVAPSTELRQWYGHVPERYPEFAQRYRAELRDSDHAVAFAQLEAFAKAGTLTLLTATKEPQISEAQVLEDALTGTLPSDPETSTGQ